MKKLNIIVALGLMTLGLASCQDGDWDNEINDTYKIGNESIVEHNVVKIKDLKATYKQAILGQGMKYSNNAVQLIEDDIQVKGVVVTNDRGGNLSQCIIITDDSNENIQISIADNDNATAEVYTADGRLVTRRQGNGQISVAPGVYIVKVNNLSYKVAVYSNK